MAKLIDLTGRKFGRLTVLEKAEPRIRPNGAKINYWKCQCDCGTIKEINGASLRCGTILSCGCWRKERNKKDLTGQKFKYLTVIEETEKDKNGRTMWLCKCKCGNYHKACTKYLLNGQTTSCGCRRKQILADTTKKNTTHGLSNSEIYHRWSGMKSRCYNPNDNEYQNYGGRGIAICEEWKDFINFYNWAINNGYSENLTIDRINVNGNYEPDNCRWTDYKIQGNNTRRNHYLTYDGTTKTMSQWADILGMSYYTLRARINQYHWSVERAFETPVRHISVANKSGN